MAGLFSSLVPSFLRAILGVHDLAVIGAVPFALFAVATISQALSARAFWSGSAPGRDGGSGFGSGALYIEAMVRDLGGNGEIRGRQEA